MLTENQNFEIIEKTIESQKIIGLSRPVKTSGFDSLEDSLKSDMKQNFVQKNEQLKPEVTTQQYKNQNMNQDPRLSTYSRNNFNPDMLKSPSKTSASPKPEITQEMRQSMQEQMDFLKNMLKLHQAVKGPMKKQALLLQDFKEDNYNKMIFGYKVETFDGVSDDFTKVVVPEGQYFTLTLVMEKASPENIKMAWKHLKDECGEKRSFAFDFQISDPMKKNITFFASAK